MATEYRPLAGLSETELVERAQQRDQDAFAELMHRNVSSSVRLALSVLKNRQEAEDEVQTSLLKAWTGLATFHSESRFSTWFRSIVLNQSMMRLRRLRRANLQSLDDTDREGRAPEVASPQPSQEIVLSRHEMNERLNAEVKKLPRLLREALVLRDIDQLPTEEVAARLGISEPALKSRLSRARNMLRERMDRHMLPAQLLV